MATASSSSHLLDALPHRASILGIGAQLQIRAQGINGLGVLALPLVDDSEASVGWRIAAIRGNSEFIIDQLSPETSRRHMTLEMKRRGLSVNEAITRAQKIRIGDRLCQLYASFGHPDTRNRTVSSGGTRVQYIYDKTFVYTTNGQITAFQD